MKRFRKFALLVPALLAALQLGSCTQDQASAASVEARLLEDMAARVGPGQLELVSLHYGSFSGNDAREVAAVFHTVEETDPAGQTITPWAFTTRTAWSWWPICPPCPATGAAVRPSTS